LQDKETGVFEALKALFSRPTYEFDRSEAVSFYLESEWEVKKRAPGAIYLDILSENYNDVALRIGMEPTRADAASFAQSITDWPLVPDAAWCLGILHTIPGLSIAAIADADHESLGRMPAFTALAPYFDTVSWDACTAYKPDRAVFEKPVQYHDALGVRHEYSCLVSGSLLADLDPPRELRVPGVWMCYHRNLAENVHIRQGAHPALIGTNLADLAAMFVAAKVPN
jgi:FMN phosphatase YigB (HAD superfamily)